MPSYAGGTEGGRGLSEVSAERTGYSTAETVSAGADSPDGAAYLSAGRMESSCQKGTGAGKLVCGAGSGPKAV